jgi:hypothetical protein
VFNLVRLRKQSDTEFPLPQPKARWNALVKIGATQGVDQVRRCQSPNAASLHKLSNQFSMLDDSDDPYSRRGDYPGRALADGDEGTEAVGNQIGKVTLRVGMIAQFTLKQR